MFFPDDPMATSNEALKRRAVTEDPSLPVVHATMHEQLTGLFDGSADLPSNQVDGSINVRTSSTASSAFCLRLRDPKAQLNRLQLDESRCHEFRPLGNSRVAAVQPHHVHLLPESGSRTIRVSTETVSGSTKRKILSYSCHQKLRPIPLLVKSKVQVAAGDGSSGSSTSSKCRVGVKIRSNPENKQPLCRMSVIMSVPPDIRGESVKLSRRGGVWDGMKRIVAWQIEELAPGDLVEIQAQFEYLGNNSNGFNNNNGSDNKPLPKFPLLVRCDMEDSLLSDIDLETDVEADCKPVRLDLTRSVRILHRKV